MTDKTELQKRLSALGDKLSSAQKHMDLKKVLFEERHSATKHELDERYKFLNDQLERQIEHEEKMGHQIGELEHSILSWLKSLDFDK